MTLLSVVAIPVIWGAVVFLRSPAVGVFHDDGVYLVTAKAIASGDGYRITSLPGTPYQTKYPILFPLLLSLVWRVAPAFPRNLIWLRLVPLLATVCWLAISWRVSRRVGAPTAVAIMALALTAASPWTLFLSTTPLSETVFAAFAAAGVLLLLEADSKTSRYAALAAGLMMGAAVLTRTAGVGTALGGLIFLGMRRRWTAAAQYVSVIAIVTLPWFIWTQMHASDAVVDPFYSGANYRAWNIVFNYSWPDKLAVLAVNTFWATQVGQFWGLPLGSWPGWVAAAVCTFWVVRGLWLERRSAVALVCVCYLAVLLAWAFPPLRFMIPILPFLIVLMFVGAGRLKPAAFVVAGILTLTAAGETLRATQASAARGGTWFDSSQIDDWNGIASLIDWVERNTPEDAVLIATHDPTFYLFTGRHGLRPDSMDPLMLYYNVRGRKGDADLDAEMFRRRLLDVGVDYVVLTPRDTTERVERLSKRFPGSFTLVYGSLESHHAIYRVERDRLGSS